MPVVDGDMWAETRMLMETCRYYDLEKVADWATTPPLHIIKEQKESEEPVSKRAKVDMNTEAPISSISDAVKAVAGA